MIKGAAWLVRVVVAGLAVGLIGSTGLATKAVAARPPETWVAAPGPSPDDGAAPSYAPSAEDVPAPGPGPGLPSTFTMITPEAQLSAVASATGVAPETVAVAVLDPATGIVAAWGDPEPQITASIVKVNILVALLLQRQDEGQGLSGRELDLATAMITESDNDAATLLWSEIGGREGLAAANVRLGLTSTVPGDGDYWGLTETTPADQVRLLDALVTPGGALSDASRTVVVSLMTAVVADQAWGVSSAGTAALKNGWLDRPDGTWSVNSIGIVTTADGRQLLLAVQSHGWTTFEEGVSAVERLAAAAAMVEL